MKAIFVIGLVILGFYSVAQTATTNDSLRLCTAKPVTVYTADYMKKYNRLKVVIVKVYPYALYAADVLDEINHNAEAIEKRRKLNKFYKESYQDLKDDFKYVFYELYTQEGIMLMKLVHRETGMTVYEIAETYRGKQNAEIFEMMGSIWDQDLKVQFDPLGEDKIAEHVITDIQAGIVPFNDEVVLLNKEEYKVEQEKDKERKKANHERIKAEEKKKKEKEKLQKKEERKSE